MNKVVKMTCFVTCFGKMLDLLADWYDDLVLANRSWPRT